MQLKSSNFLESTSLGLECVPLKIDLHHVASDSFFRASPFLFGKKIEMLIS